MERTPTQTKMRFDSPPPWAVAIVALCAVASIHLSAKWYWSDNAAYLLLSDNLVSGKGYTDTYWPNGGPHSHFPPGMAVLYAPVTAIFGANPLAANTFTAFLSFIATLLAYTTARRRGLNERESTAVFLLFGTSPYFWQSSGLISSDTPFAAIAMLAIMFTDAASKKSGVSRNLVLAALFNVIGYYLRSVGMALIAGCCFYLLVAGEGGWKNRFVRTSFVGIVSFLCAMPWIVHVANIGHDTYFSLVRSGEGTSSVSTIELVARGWPRLVFYAETFVHWNLHGSAALGRKVPIAFYALTVLSSLLIFGGILTSLKKRASASDYFVPACFALLLPWFWYFDRFLMPVMIYLLLYFWSACSGILSRLAESMKLRLAKVAPFALAVLIALNIAGNVRKAVARNAPDKTRDDFMASCKFVRENSPADAIVYTRLSIVAALESNRVGDEETLRKWPGNAYDAMKRRPAYIITQGYDTAYDEANTSPFLNAFRDKTRLVYTAPGGTGCVYEIVHAPR